VRPPTSSAPNTTVRCVAGLAREERGHGETSCAGRKSGKQCQTPVTARWTADGFVIGLPYGPNTDWLKNVLASGVATLVHNGSSYQCDEPEIISASEAAGGFSAAERRILRLMGVDEYLRMHRVESAEGV